MKPLSRDDFFGRNRAPQRFSRGFTNFLDFSLDRLYEVCYTVGMESKGNSKAGATAEEKAMTRITVRWVEDIRPTDLEGRKLAVAEAEMRHCDCCGRKIVQLHHLSTGHVVGRECAAWITRPDTIALCRPRFSRRQREFLGAQGIRV